MKLVMSFAYQWSTIYFINFIFAIHNNNQSVLFLNCLNDNNIAVVPSEPKRLNFSIASYGRDSVSVTVTWSTSTGTDNYTVVVLPQLQSTDPIFTVNTTSLCLTLQYNTQYFMNVTASNCVGRSNSLNSSFIIGLY